jgi:pyruvate dehydrogenase E1 component
MYEKGESIFYYLTLGNENYPMLPMPAGVEEGVLRGMYRCRPASSKSKYTRIHLLGSGAILREALRAQELLAERYQVAADVWSVTSYKELRRDALECERWSRLHPLAESRKNYVEKLLAREKGIFIAASDFMKSLPEMINRWVPGGLVPLGTDGFGRSEGRAALRRFFEVDAECITLTALDQLARRGEFKPEQVQQAIRELGIDPDKSDPVRT